MSKLTISLLGLFAATCCSFSIRADEREAFETFAKYIVGGTWHGTDENGNPLKHTYRWILGKKFLLRVENDNALQISGVDPTDGTFTGWIFNSDGSVEIVKSTSEALTENTSRLTILVEPKLDLTIERGEDEIVVTGDIDATWKRKPLEGDFPSLASDPPKDMPKLMKAISGPKWVSGHLSGDDVYGTTFGQWILNGKFFLFTSTFLSKNEGEWGIIYVFGKDPETGKPAGWEFGGYENAVTKWTLTNQGMTITGKATMPGNTFTFSGTHTITENGLVEYTASGKMADDLAEIPYGWTYHPVK